MFGSAWTTRECDDLVRMAAAGRTSHEIAKELGRSFQSVRNKGIKLGVKFPRPNESGDDEDNGPKSFEVVCKEHLNDLRAAYPQGALTYQFKPSRPSVTRYVSRGGVSGCSSPALACVED